MIEVVVADDHHLVRQGICALLEKADDIAVVGEAADGREAITLVQALVPDVLVLDVMMPGLNGTEAAKRIADLRLKTRVLMLSMYSDRALVRQALRNGAKGYVLKRSVTAELLGAIRSISRGESHLSQEVSASLLADFISPGQERFKASPLELLTSREREVLQLIAEGSTNAKVAACLNISEKTVEKHRTNLMAKLDIHEVSGLVRFAIKYGLISVSE